MSVRIAYCSAFALFQLKKGFDLTAQNPPTHFSSRPHNFFRLVRSPSVFLLRHRLTFCRIPTHSLLKSSFLGEEFNKKIHFHPSHYSKFYSLVPSFILPLELGRSFGPSLPTSSTVTFAKISKVSRTTRPKCKFFTSGNNRKRNFMSQRWQ